MERANYIITKYEALNEKFTKESVVNTYYNKTNEEMIEIVKKLENHLPNGESTGYYGYNCYKIEKIY